MVLHLCVLLAGVPPLAVFTTQFGYTRFRSVHRPRTGSLGTLPRQCLIKGAKRGKSERGRGRERLCVCVRERADQPSHGSFSARIFRYGHFLGFNPGSVTLPVRTKPVRFTQHFLLSAGRSRCGSFLRTNPFNNPANILGRDIPVWAYPQF